MLKVEDAKLPDVQRALKGAGVKVISIVELYKEGAPDNKSEDKPEETA
jgi:hypothetical protein